MDKTTLLFNNVNCTMSLTIDITDLIKTET